MSDGTVYINVGGEIEAFNAATGSVRWIRQVGLSTTASLAFAKGHLYEGTNEAIIWVYLANGDFVSNNRVGESHFDQSPAIANGVIYEGADDNVGAYDLKTDALLWSAPLQHVQASPVIANGMLYVLSAGSLYAFGLKD